MSRPEYGLPPEFYYNEREAKKYSQSTRIIDIQAQMSDRCLELLNLKAGKPALLLDIGCGSGISGEVINENGFHWVGVDISRDMLNVAQERETEGELYQCDMGQGLSFRPGVFDGAVSVSALQWLFVASKKNDVPFKRLCKFFQSLNNCLSKGARAALQFYPDGPEQIEMATSSAVKAGLKTGLIIDYPNSTKARKIYLLLSTSDEDLSSIKPRMLEMEEMEEEKVDGQVSSEDEKEEKKADYLSKRSKHIHKKKSR